ncbi:UspA domain-containing protein [Natrinema pellirubrum DSM 15624]|uniref:Universal stress protein UspA-like protein n=1 Tax=Natrinema pellirubrum (strain DSM 15624 / CIP 106293 / JCM 10476 / NCIMB 786 / 157) TaxID=797303 RepID=L0JIM2_NATP1|nr:universal stress protein [Natrinema pellirubrum]AGB31360.1 universal stress protein UspA-like protein [Natrinema pellirubrum DSM 15624]ELY81704.1 UspA domain-containing protein [Natrinema pellirubrum DSM 15624]
MADRVLVPYDGSPQATDALELTFDEFPDATVIALYVIEIPDGRWAQLLGPELQAPVSEKAKEHAADVLETATELAAESGRSLETNVVTGEPDDRIVAQAAAESVDLIVIGSHGKEGVSRVLLGSVAETVVRRSPVPVLVVR